VRMSAGSWDERIMSAVADHRVGALDEVANRVSETGQSETVLVIAGMAVVLVALWRGWYRPCLAAAAAFVAASIAVAVLKPMFDRPRPPRDLALVWVDGPSFPSTHATTTSALAVAVLISVVWGTRRRAALATVVLGSLVVFVGLCMVYLGAHWPTDVLAGWMLGGALGGGIGWLARPRPPGAAEPVGRARVGHAR
jgi:membrane-associated phospholipid phosphatase